MLDGLTAITDQNDGGPEAAGQLRPEKGAITACFSCGELLRFDERLELVATDESILKKLAEQSPVKARLIDALRSFAALRRAGVDEERALGLSAEAFSDAMRGDRDDVETSGASPFDALRPKRKRWVS